MASNPYLDLLKGSATPTATAAPTKQATSSNPYLDVLNEGSSAPTQSTKAPASKTNFVPPNTTTFKTASGNLGVKTPSGSSWEYLPDGTRQISLAPQFGSGVYNVNTQNPNKIINLGHTTYGGVPAEANMNRDDKMPVSLGGVNTNPANIKVVPKNDNPAQLETKLAEDVKSGKTTLGQARAKIIDYKTTNQNYDPKNSAPSTSVAANFIPALGDTAKDFAKGLVKPFVETGVSLVNAGRDVGSLIKGPGTNGKYTDYSNASYKVPLYGEAAPLFTGSEKPGELARKAAGTALEVAPYFLAMPELKEAQATLQTLGSKSISELTSKEVQTFTKAYAKKLLTSSVTLGTMFGSGQSLQENADAKKTVSNILKSTATVAAMEAFLAPVIGKAFEKGGDKTVDEAIKDIHNEPITATPEIKTNPYAEELKKGNAEPAKSNMGTAETPSVETKAPEKTVFSSPEKIKETATPKVEAEPKQTGLARENKPFDKAQVFFDDKGKMVKAKYYQPIENKPIETPDIKTSKLAQGVELKAIKNKLTDSFEGKPEYATVNVEKQAQAASDLIKSDREKAINIAMGHELPPEGVLPESVFVAVENHAIATKDVSLLRDLATSSSLTTEATGMGQRLRMLAERNPDSAVSAIRDVVKSKEAGVEKRFGKDLKKIKSKVKDEIKAEMTKNSPKADAWKSFIDEIKCK